jgi:outer membrane protein OmpA-like peptidoglycan-associated protein
MPKGQLTAVLIAAMLSVNTAFAGEAKAVSSEWGNSVAKPAPVADSKGRKGFWWWPKEAISNKDDAEVWGNRGIVYGEWKKPIAATKTPASHGHKRLISDPGPLYLNNILFDFGKAVLNAGGKAETDKVVALMKKYKNTVVIEGHTCSEGAADYNMALGLKRAEAVKKYMVESGIEADRIKTVSFGETKPAVPNTDTPIPGNGSPTRILNRRVEFKITAHH